MDEEDAKMITQLRELTIDEKDAKMVTQLKEFISARIAEVLSKECPRCMFLLSLLRTQKSLAFHSEETSKSYCVAATQFRNCCTGCKFHLLSRWQLSEPDPEEDLLFPYQKANPNGMNALIPFADRLERRAKKFIRDELESSSCYTGRITAENFRLADYFDLGVELEFPRVIRVGTFILAPIDGCSRETADGIIHYKYPGNSQDGIRYNGTPKYEIGDAGGYVYTFVYEDGSVDSD